MLHGRCWRSRRGCLARWRGHGSVGRRHWRWGRSGLWRWCRSGLRRWRRRGTGRATTDLGFVWCFWDFEKKKKKKKKKKKNNPDILTGVGTGVGGGVGGFVGGEGHCDGVSAAMGKLSKLEHDNVCAWQTPNAPPRLHHWHGMAPDWMVHEAHETNEPHCAPAAGAGVGALVFGAGVGALVAGVGGMGVGAIVGAPVVVGAVDGAGVGAGVGGTG